MAKVAPTHVPFKNLIKGDLFETDQGFLYMKTDPVWKMDKTMTNAVCLGGTDDAFAGNHAYFEDMYACEHVDQVIDFSK